MCAPVGRDGEGIDYKETFLPIAMLMSIQILLSIAAAFDYEISQMDVKMTFLNGYLNESIYMEQLRLMGSHKIWMSHVFTNTLMMGR